MSDAEQSGGMSTSAKTRSGSPLVCSVSLSGSIMVPKAILRHPRTTHVLTRLHFSIIQPPEVVVGPESPGLVCGTSLNPSSQPLEWRLQLAENKLEPARELEAASVHPHPEAAKSWTPSRRAEDERWAGEPGVQHRTSLAKPGRRPRLPACGSAA